jgi:exosortase A-associated hydrolase 2
LSDVDLSASFVGKQGQRLFVLMHRPRAGARNCVLVVPPFAEEMNKSRRMVALVAQGLAARGINVALADLYGTGDSEGEFHQGNWSRWKQDLADVGDFLVEQGLYIAAVLGVRTGCALAAQMAQERQWRLRRTVFWQPVPDGAKFLTQFLRLRVAASLMDQDRKESVSELRSRLRAGEMIEVAGYGISSRMADELDQVRLDASLGEHLGEVHWFDVVRDESVQPSQIAVHIAGVPRERDVFIRKSIICGEPFWSSTEIVQIPELIDKTIATLAEVA